MSTTTKEQSHEAKTEVDPAATQPTLQTFYVRKFDVSVKAASAREAAEKAKQLSKKGDK